MSQTKWYRGSRRWVICQAPDGAGHLCWRPVRSTGTGMVMGHSALLYECTAGHRFSLTNKSRDPGKLQTRGELDGDGSGESANSPIQSWVSGESQNSPEPAYPNLDPKYTDFRKVTLLPRERPVFGAAPRK